MIRGATKLVIGLRFFSVKLWSHNFSQTHYPYGKYNAQDTSETGMYLFGAIAFLASVFICPELFKMEIFWALMRVSGVTLVGVLIGLCLGQ
jgi:hypothetical protein